MDCAAPCNPFPNHTDQRERCRMAQRCLQRSSTEKKSLLKNHRTRDQRENTRPRRTLSVPSPPRLQSGLCCHQVRSSHLLEGSHVCRCTGVVKWMEWTGDSQHCCRLDVPRTSPQKGQGNRRAGLGANYFQVVPKPHQGTSPFCHWPLRTQALSQDASQLSASSPLTFIPVQNGGVGGVKPRHRAQAICL